MADLLFFAGSALLLLTALGLAVLWRGGGRSDVDRMLAIQLLGAASIAILLLLAPAMGEPALLDGALLLALLAALAACAYRAALGPPERARAAAAERRP